jgi:ABC-type sulfate transport system substrate-binding protein
MAGLITIAELRAMFSISDDIADGRLLRHLGAASRRLRGWVGNSVYDDAASTTSVDTDRKEDLELAEAALAMHFAILGLNTNLRPGGIVKAERVEGDALITYLVPSEVQQLAVEYLNQAEEVVRPYAGECAETPGAGG